MKSLVTMIVFSALAQYSFAGDDQSREKEKAKAKAEALISINRETERKVKGEESPIIHNLKEAQLISSKTKKPIVLWIGVEPNMTMVKEVEAVHCETKTYDEVKTAKVVVITCKADGTCERRSSVDAIPSVEVLKGMVEEAKKKMKDGISTALNDDAFQISYHYEGSAPERDEEQPPTNGDKAKLKAEIATEKKIDDKPIKVVRYETRLIQECYTDERGIQRCRTVQVNVPVEATSSTSVQTTTPVSAVVLQASSEELISRGFFRPLKRIREAFASFRATRPRLLAGSFSGGCN